MDNLDTAPVAVDGEVIYLGLPGLGILLIDRLTSDIVDLWTPDDPNGIPDEDVNTLALDFFGGLLVGSEVQNTGANSNGGLAGGTVPIGNCFPPAFPDGTTIPSSSTMFPAMPAESMLELTEGHACGTGPTQTTPNHSSHSRTAGLLEEMVVEEGEGMACPPAS